MKKVVFNIKHQESPSKKCKKSELEFLLRFTKYVHSSGLTIDDIKTKPAVYVIKTIIEKTFVLSLEKDDNFNGTGHLAILNGTLVLATSDKDYKFSFHDQVVEIQNLSKPIFEKIGNKINCNIADLFIPDYEKYLKDIVVGSIFSRYNVYTKYSCLKRLVGVKWTNSNDIRWAIKEVEKEMGVTEKEFFLTNGNTMLGLAPMKKMIHNSCKGTVIAQQSWEITFPEEKEIFLQGGDSGLVFSKNGNYLTAFVEVFPKFLKDKNNVFSSFIRGEGQNIQEAELQAFNLLKQAKTCTIHEWETRGRTDGCGFCKKCKVFNSKAFPEFINKS